MTLPDLTVVGGGLAGVEAAWWAAQYNTKVTLYEMRPHTSTPAHRTSQMAELVCSNSLRGDDATSAAVGLLKEELRSLGSLIMQSADATRLPAGGSLTVDREAFSDEITKQLEQHPLIHVVRQEALTLPKHDTTIVATGPLTSETLAKDLENHVGEHLAFFDALSPVVFSESLDWNHLWRQSRYDRDTDHNKVNHLSPAERQAGDYLNCAMDSETYTAFIQALQEAEPTTPKDWEGTPYFEGCLPLEVMAARGPETLRYGPLKPVGLTDPRTGTTPHAVIQLRQDNRHGTLWSLVGCQTRLRHRDQVGTFQLIPALRNARFARLGGMHRNTYVNAPACLTDRLQLHSQPNVYLAGQMIGVEGYVESASMGLLCSLLATNPTAPLPPETTAIGALRAYVTDRERQDRFQPMNVNFGLFPPLTEHTHTAKRQSKKARRLAIVDRARQDLKHWTEQIGPTAIHPTKASSP